MNNDITKKMLSVIREGVEKSKTYKVKPLEEESKPIVRENMLTEWKRLDKNDILKKKVIKEDIDSFDDLKADIIDLYIPLGYQVIFTSALEKTGLEELKPFLEDIEKLANDNIELGCCGGCA